MGLQSNLFKGNPALEACLLYDYAHIPPGAVGNHVGKIQTALVQLDGLQIDPSELAADRYGPSTAAAVLQYKTKRNIINFSYETRADNTVGKLTIASLDQQMLQQEQSRPSKSSTRFPASSTWAST